LGSRCAPACKHDPTPYHAAASPHQGSRDRWVHTAEPCKQYSLLGACWMRGEQGDLQPNKVATL
jgi:hypothetical protein